MIASLYLGLLVKNLSRTCWSDRHEAIRAVLTSYQEIINTFQKMSETDPEKATRQTAENLLHKLCSFSFYIILLFFKNLMAMISDLIVQLQKIDTDILIAVDIIQDTTHVLEKIYKKIHILSLRFK